MNQSRCCSYLAQNYTLIHVFLFQRLIIVSLFLNLSKILRARLKSHFQEKNLNSSERFIVQMEKRVSALSCPSTARRQSERVKFLFPLSIPPSSFVCHASATFPAAYFFPIGCVERERSAPAVNKQGGRGEEVADDRIDRRPASLVRSHPRAHLLTSWPRR